MAKPKPKPDNPAQSKRFRDMARQLEADDRPEEFERVFESVVVVPKAKPSQEPPFD